MLYRIEINPGVMTGKPVIKGTRIPLYLILNLLAKGYDYDRIQKAYPVLEKKDIQAALEYSEKRLKREEFFPLIFEPALG